MASATQSRHAGQTSQAKPTRCVFYAQRIREITTD